MSPARWSDAVVGFGMTRPALCTNRVTARPPSVLNLKLVINV